MNNKIVYFSIVITVILLRIDDIFFGITGGHQINREKVLTDIVGCISYLLIYAAFSKCVRNQTKPTILISVVLMIIVGGIWLVFLELAIYYFANPGVFQLMQENIFIVIEVNIIDFFLVFCMVQIPIMLMLLIWNFANRRWVR